MRKEIKILIGLSAFLPVVASCNKTKSYSELLNEEEKAVNWYLSSQKIVPYVPSDSIFEIGEEAPFYKMDENGNVYMQVINRGDMSSRPQKGDKVYFRLKDKNIKDLFQGGSAPWGGNAENLEIPTYSLIYGNTSITSTVKWGEGIQVPLQYVGYNSEVNLLIKSPMGMVEDQSQCIPYLYNIKYFKAEY